MKYFVYFFVALIAAGSVLFGLDFTSAPMPPMPESRYALRAAVPPPAPAVVTETKSAPKTEAAASAVAVKPLEAPVAPAPAPVPVAVVTPPPAPVDQQPAPITTEEAVSAEPPAPPAPRCDLDACAAAYRSFTPEDCTYQPFDGPRQMCTKGKPPVAASPAAAEVPATSGPSAAPQARAQACNVAACTQAYISFSAADCTYQPTDGPRRACTK